MRNATIDSPRGQVLSHAGNPCHVSLREVKGKNNKLLDRGDADPARGAN